MSDTNKENEAWLIKTGQVKNPKEAAKPNPTEKEE